MNIGKTELILEIAPILKSKGYKRKNTTWIKQTKDNNIYLVFNLQGSQYDKEIYYVNLGVYIRELGTKSSPTCISDCQMQERVDHEINTSGFIINITDKWEEWYGSYDLIYEKVRKHRMPMLTDKRIYLFFASPRQT